MKKLMNITAVAVVCGLFATAMADWWINADGTGFVGKGDVQAVYGWNDHDLQENAALVMFRAIVDEVSEVSWTCTNSNNGNTQVRKRTTTTTGESEILEEVRLNPVGHVTGFNLLGWDGTPNFVTETGGPPLNSCPAGPWSLTTPAGAPVIISSSSAAQVSIDAVAWLDLMETP